MPNPLIAASLVYDGGNIAHVPSQMGAPNGNQLAGTAAENTCELALRVCYDSLGAAKSRSSEAAHAHIKEVKHLSVFEHVNFTVEFKAIGADATSLMALANRPGLWLDFGGLGSIRITLNLRSVLEWDDWTKASIHNPAVAQRADSIGGIIRTLVHTRVPMIVPPEEGTTVPAWCAGIVDPSNEHEQWITLYVTGSRGLSHELVRHGDFTAISQRSTRYVDEDGSPWVEHPLVSMFIAAGDAVHRAPNGEATELSLKQRVGHVVSTAAQTYGEVVSRLEPWLVARGVDKFTARKQARGAARGYLGNALHTELVFSANVSQWKRMMGARCNPAADAEIRELFAKCLPVLKASRYGSAFERMGLASAPDGIGEVLVDVAPAP